MISSFTPVILEKTIIYNNEEWKLNFIPEENSITIHLEKFNNNIYESNFKLEYMKKFKFFSLTNSIKSIIELIDIFIKQNQFSIKEIEKENKCILSLIQYSEKFNELELIINKQIKNNKNEKINKNKNFEFNSLNLIKLNTINAHNTGVSCLRIFPSGKLISTSWDCSIKIWNQNFKLLQKIKNAHYDGIFYVDIKDENNFVTCSTDCNIKTWIKKDNKFKLNEIILNSHISRINKVIYSLNGLIISCSADKKIKIWEKIKNNYQCITILSHNDSVESILLLENINLLVSSGLDGTKIWNFNNFNCIKYFPDVKCLKNNTLDIIDNEKIIVGGTYDHLMKVISLSEKKIIQVIDNQFDCFGILVLNDKDIILTIGRSDDLRIYRKDNFECIKMILSIHDNDVNDIIKLNDNVIASCSCDKTIKIWSFN